MLKINKITSDTVVDFAAEELKKYLRMMMPRVGEIDIAYDPLAKDGFRLGLLQDFGIEFEKVDNVKLDDIVHIDTTAEGGIIAGDNPRSVLLAVYKYLRLNGCRWIFPGVDGEFIPIKDVEGFKYHKVADHRYRGQCNEGAETQTSVLETIDFTPKLGMNSYMLEFDVPYTYYEKYYNHRGNPNREKEPVNADTVLQWKRASEVELKKRGLNFFDMGHGWNAESFGISSVEGWTQNFDNPIPEESRKYLAMINGKRDLFNGVALNTQICMSNPEARKIVKDCIVEYAKKGRNVDCLKISLADWQMNHCECDECRKMRPSDWYVMLLNEVDEALTKEGIDTILGAGIYSDTAWEPEHNEFKNPDRFALSLAPITRNYLSSVPENPVPEKLTPYVRNKSGRLDTLEEYVWRAHEWEKMAKCPMYVYEYHFWKEQFYNPSPLDLAYRIHDDVLAYRKNGFNGMIEDCSQRHFFPNALGFTVYGATLFDVETSLENTIDDYFAHAYGTAKDVVKKFFEDMQKYFPHEFVETVHSKPVNIAHYHNPDMIPSLEKTIELCNKLDEDLKEYRNMPYRVQTVSIRLLGYYTEYLRGFAQAFILKAQSKDEEAKKFYTDFLNEFGKKEVEIERYYDHFMSHVAFDPIFKSGAALPQQ